MHTLLTLHGLSSGVHRIPSWAAKHVAEQQSPSRRLPSSHVSGSSILPLPQPGSLATRMSLSVPFELLGPRTVVSVSLDCQTTTRVVASAAICGSAFAP